MPLEHPSLDGPLEERENHRMTFTTWNRHEMAVRWLRAIKGKKLIRLVERTEAAPAPRE